MFRGRKKFYLVPAVLVFILLCILSKLSLNIVGKIICNQLITRVSPTGVLQSDVVAKLKIDEF